MRLLHNAVFSTSVAHFNDLPGDAVREIAFAGRSNAGKSSAINTLAGRARLAFVSKTPGRTQLLNYFQLEPGKYLVDLPGYGYAKAPDAVRDHWEGLINPYLQYREALVGLILIMDSRHPLTDLDWRLLEWFAPTRRPMHILLSKADKLSRQESLDTLRKVKAELAAIGSQFTVQLFSSLKKTGIEEAEDRLAQMLEIVLPEKTEITRTLKAPKAATVRTARFGNPGKHKV